MENIDINVILNDVAQAWLSLLTFPGAALLTDKQTFISFFPRSSNSALKEWSFLGKELDDEFGDRVP